MASLKRSANKPRELVPGYIPEVPNRDLTPYCIKIPRKVKLTLLEPPHRRPWGGVRGLVVYFVAAVTDTIKNCVRDVYYLYTVTGC